MVYQNFVPCITWCIVLCTVFIGSIHPCIKICIKIFDTYCNIDLYFFDDPDYLGIASFFCGGPDWPNGVCRGTPDGS